jgi:general secretion pathway protein M
MVEWIKSHRRSALIVGFTLVVPTYVFFLLLGNALSLRAQIGDQINGIEPRVARMLGLIEKEEALRSSLSGVRSIMNDHVYRKATDAEGVAASLQAEARRIVASSGMEVTNSQVLPIRKREMFDYIAIKLVARGTLNQLDESLAELANFRPVIFVESIDAFPNRRRGRDSEEEQVLTVSLELLSLRAAS